MKPARTTTQPQPPSGAVGTASSSSSSSSLSTLSCLLRLKSEQTLSLVSEPTVIIRNGLFMPTLTLGPPLSTSAVISFFSYTYSLSLKLLPIVIFIF